MPALDDPIAFSLGPIDVRWYALFILLGIACGLALSYWLAGKRGYDPGFLLDLSPWLVLRMPRTSWMRPGDVGAIYLIAYGVGRFAIERMRTDSLYIGSLPAAYWLSMLMIGGGVILMVLTRTMFRSNEPVSEIA